MFSPEELDLLKRAVLALESNAIHQKRVADHLDKEAATQSKFRETIEGLVGDTPTSVVEPNPEGVGAVEESPKVVDWFIDINHKDRPVMVKLSNGEIRPPTSTEAAKLK